MLKKSTDPQPGDKARVHIRPDGEPWFCKPGTGDGYTWPHHDLQKITFEPSGLKAVVVSVPGIESEDPPLRGYLTKTGEEIFFKRFLDGELIIFGR